MGYIERTGNYSNPSQLKWTNWEAGDSSYERPHAWGEHIAIDEVRKGVAKSLLFSFTIYEARNSTSSWPVIGPNWGGHVRLYVPIIIASFGLLLFLYSCKEAG